LKLWINLVSIFKRFGEFSHFNPTLLILIEVLKASTKYPYF